MCVLVLFLLVGSVGKIGRENAKRIVCASNISQLLQGLTFYAIEHDGRLPYQEIGYWPWDFSCDVTNVLLDSMGIDVQKPSAGQDIPVQDIFYCPSNIPQKKARNLYWGFAVNPINGTGFRVIGYLFLWVAEWNENGRYSLPGSGDKHFVRTIYVDNPSETELVIDIVVSDKRPTIWPPDEYPDGNFARILCGGMPSMYGIYDSSSHLVTDKEPAGGNIGFVDGHVAWRPFSQMENRWPPPGDCPDWWW
jgi:prepilin-type processing-associated H-X9-DG protein